MTEQTEVVESVEPEKAPHVIEVRNIMRVATGQFNCEVLHEEFGWIPFLACKSEAEKNDYAKAVFDHIKANKIKVKSLPECPTVESWKRTNARDWRNEELARADVIINKIEDFEIEGDSKVWRKYRVTLRNWPATSDFPATKPTAPDA